MNRSAIQWTVVLVGLASCLPAAAATSFTGSRSNVSLGGVPNGRCAPAITVLFSPDAASANGQSNLGSFSYRGSHCIAGIPPGPYFDGEFEWDFGDGKLFGTYEGMLTAGDVPAQFKVAETISFTGGSGRFLDTTGSATAAGTLSFGMLEGVSVSFGDATFEGSLNMPAVPEPASWALMLAGLAAVGALRRGRGQQPDRATTLS